MQPGIAERLDAAVQDDREEAVGLLRRLISAGRAGEAGVQDVVERDMSALGCRVERLSYSPADVPMVEEFAAEAAMATGRRESLVARIPGSGGGRSLLLFAHPDCEPVSGLAGWRHDPFAGESHGGRLYGWGAADDLAGVAATVAALRAVTRAGIALSGDAVLCSTPSKRHARGVSALLHAGLAADAAVYLHPAESGAGLREIKAFASGQLEFRIDLEGRPPETTEPL